MLKIKQRKRVKVEPSYLRNETIERIADEETVELTKISKRLGVD